MDHIIGGSLLALAGCLLGFATYKKYNIFWDFINARLLRKWLGDTATSRVLYTVSAVLIVVGALVATGLIR
jgi:hypothetical protein